ncbi:cupredoxin domain-containing protein [Mariniflexile ostreae]|uniref:Cupredoxin domain-containing protein n=1 Tax=Mariniflexile ostreae TaxID=1520892 RepID=A0ABV5F9B9_9FLAO
MKKAIAVVLLVVGINFSAQAQEVKTISLEQTKGAFVQESLTLEEGTYVFEIANKNVGHDIGFVLAPKGKPEEAHHIKDAYVTKTVATNSKEKSKEVTLKKGEYIYFCPLNPTPEYTLIVK